MKLRVARLYELARRSRLTPDQIADLALALAEGGTLRPSSPGAADLASSGGPGSLSTLLVPLMLAADGATVPKVGVPGRPAGGVDVLGTLPGYRYSLDPEMFNDVLAACGYAHTTANEHWAPGDAELFRLRQLDGLQGVPGLVAASLLAKKIVAGVTHAGLEARLGRYGNLGSTLQEVSASAALYCEAADHLGLDATVFVTDGSVAYQPFIGRGEALQALSEVLYGPSDNAANGWLARHVELCHTFATQVSNSLNLPTDRRTRTLAEVFEDNLRAQGSDPVAFRARVNEVASAPRSLLAAPCDGHVHYDLGQIRSVLVAAQAAHHAQFAGTETSAVPDPAGVILLVQPGLAVREGDPVLAARGLPAQSRLAETFSIRADPSGSDNTLMRTVRS